MECAVPNTTHVLLIQISADPLDYQRTRIERGAPQQDVATSRKRAYSKRDEERDITEEKPKIDALVCGILFIASSIGILILGDDRSVASYVGMAILPLLFLVGTIHFWKAS
jgi:hypothetical protein